MAVQHYLDHGRCVAATIKALDYPSRALLSAWVKELHPEARTRVVERFHALTPAKKQAAVIALCMREGGAQSVAEDLGVSRPSLYNWKNQLLGREAPTSMKRKPKSLPSSEQQVELEQQLEALRRDIRRLQLEQDLLKKANELVKNWASTGSS